MTTGQGGGDPWRRLEPIGLGVGVIVLVLVAAIRLPRQAMWIDEAFTRAAVNDFWGYARSRSGNMFLYTVVVRGFAGISTATWWLRMPSVLAGLGTLIVLRPVARRVGGSRLAVVAVPVTALLVQFQWAATNMRAYGLVILLSTLAWYIALEADARVPGNQARRWWMALAMVGSIGAATHGLFVAQLVPIAVVLTVRRGLRSAVSVLWPTAVGAGVTVGVFLIVGTGGRNGVTVPGGVAAWIGQTFTVFFGGRLLTKLVLAELVLVAMVAFYISVRDQGFRRSWKPLVPISWAILPAVVVALLDPLFTGYSARYVQGSLPGVALAASGAVLWCADRLSSRTSGATRPAQVGAVALIVVLLIGAGTTPYPWQQDWRGAVALISAEARPGDAMVFTDDPGQYPQFSRPGFEATWAESRHPVDPVVLSPRRPLGKVQIDDEVRGTADVARDASHFDRVWMVQAQIGEEISRNIETLARRPELREYVQVGRWDFQGNIVVVLYERRPRGR